jgi:hypothetical protein
MGKRDASTERRAVKRGFVPILLGVALSLVIDAAAAEVASDNELYGSGSSGIAGGVHYVESPRRTG